MNTEKKEWITPLATEINVNGGTDFGNNESYVTGFGNHGSIS
ncbi:hypothetical protein SAMN05192550_0559 [Flavobacterium glycines]|uniref:Uncharacterized protein n=1 Tax=Flavobacterium glycines TaxID=551990 RepID=A0A511CCP9_9FLAO|nr:hypothetical protein [Flavobacterium glycines]GEL10407.1 hypothetical protein FGL01_11460 [Flavobacterium glycines]SDI69324.1 hypothetical protein SAMN05192550_0559 [Flavobacterium glycines]